MHKRSLMAACAIGMTLMLFVSGQPAAAQVVTTGSMGGVVRDTQGAVVPGVTVSAVHVPSGTTYETVTRGDGRFVIDGMRVGGPYTATASLAGFNTEAQESLTVSIGTTTEVVFTLTISKVTETVTVVGKSDIVFSSSRTGAATAVLREELSILPTVSGRINDMTRLSPQSTGAGAFGGADNRMNNITVDGSYFNNSFGLGGQPGDRTGVAPISLEAIEQVQVNVAPYDVRQGNFVGATVNTVTRSGSNRYTGSVYYRMRNESFVGKEQSGLAFNPGTFETTDLGEWFGGPIVKNKLFFFESYESQKDKRPLTTYTSRPDLSTPATGNTTRVLASDLTELSSFLKSKFNYDTGPYEGLTDNTPAKPFLLKVDYNLNGSNKISFRYNQLSSSSDSYLSGSGSWGYSGGRRTYTNDYLTYQNSTYSILENIKSGIGEWNSVISQTMTNNLIIGYTTQDESRADITLFPFVDILKEGTVYTSFGSELYTPANKLYYNTFQAQDSFTKYGRSHSLTFGGAVEKYHSDNSYYPGLQSLYAYKSLNDFYTDANDYLANPSRTTSPVTLARFQVAYSNVVGQPVPPFQMLDVWYTSAYAQDVWKPRSNLTITGGLRMDVAKFGDTAIDNPAVDALTFRDGNGNPVQYNTGKLPDASPLWSPRVGFNWDVTGDKSTQIRGGTGIFTGKPIYVWISNQIGNTGMLTGTIDTRGDTTKYPFNPNPDAYKPAATGNPPASASIAVTDPNFRFPQVFRTNIALDRRLPWDLVATGEFIYNRDVNGMAYFNANLPAAQSAFTGVDGRPRWTGLSCSAPTVGPCQSAINNAAGNQVTQNIVLSNQDVGRSWLFSASVMKPLWHGLQFKSAYSYGETRNTVDPGSVAAGSWNANPIVSDSNKPSLAFSSSSPGHRFFISGSYTKQYFGWGATTVAAYFNVYTNGNSSYIFGSDANGDTGTNDLIYIPRDVSEMNFKSLTTGGITFTPDQQAAAFEAYINQDAYLSKHRGEYAKRGAVFYPLVKRMDLSVTQDVFHSVKGMKHSGQIRLDITNFGNLLNHNWGGSQSLYTNRILGSPSVVNGALAYTLYTVSTASGPELLSQSFRRTADLSDVYALMLTFRYTFN
jgi:hypothetical protein